MLIEQKFKLSEDQERILQEYESGFASVLATPGSGKTTIITYLIDKLINKLNINPSSILVLTLTESAAKEFEKRTIQLLNKTYRIPKFSTIHSFCNSVILKRFHKTFDSFEVLTETGKNEFLSEILVEKGFPVLTPDEAFERGEVDYLTLFKDSVIPIFRKEKNIVNKFKEMVLLDSSTLRNIIGGVHQHHLKCLKHIPDIVEEYENYLNREKKVDFEMMINETFKILNEEKSVLDKIQSKYKYILEDEAQDSNSIQSKILKLIAGENGNYIRVGDPNQSIFTTFTGADYKDLMFFYKNNTQFDIKQSNRSNQDIIDAANHIVSIYNTSFPAHHVKIMQGEYNPQNGWVKVEYFDDIGEEINSISKNLDLLLKKDKNITISVLTRTNNQAKEMYENLSNEGFECVLHGNVETDFFNNPTILKITSLIGYILYPFEYERLKNILSFYGIKDEFINDYFDNEEESYSNLKAIAEDKFIYFGDEEQDEKLTLLCKNIYRLDNRIFSSVSEILELINNLFILDIKEKAIARILHQMWIRSRPGIMNIEDFYLWLIQHSKTKIRQNIDTETEELFSNPGKVNILTVHKAKGLQWDAVFLPNFSKWDYKDDSWKGTSEKRDIKSVIFSLLESRPRNLVRETLAQEEIHESRRVAYVGLTRAKKYLFVSCSRQGLSGKENQPSEIFEYLKVFQEEKDGNKST